MEEEIRAPVIDHRATARKLTIGGVLLTLAWLLIAGGLLWWKFDTWATLELNQWGDFLAGVSAPIALLWLVLGYFQQGIELRQNTSALELQYRELKRQVKETAELARHAGKQVEAAEKLVAVTGASVRQAAEQAEAEYRPIFTLGGTTSGMDGPYMMITNIGASVSSIRFAAFETGGKAHITELNSWSSQGQHNIRIPPDAKYPILVKIEFTTGLQFRRTSHHLIPSYGRFEVVEDKDFVRQLSEIALG